MSADEVPQLRQTVESLRGAADLIQGDVTYSLTSPMRPYVIDMLHTAHVLEAKADALEAHCRFLVDICDWMLAAHESGKHDMFLGRGDWDTDERADGSA